MTGVAQLKSSLDNRDGEDLGCMKDDISRYGVVWNGGNTGE
jgi:hypothetical protein